MGAGYDGFNLASRYGSSHRHRKYSMPRCKKPRKRLDAHKSKLVLDPKLNGQIIEDFNLLFDQHNEDWKFSYQKTQFLTKYVGPDTDPAAIRRQRAIEKWLATELRNAETNHRLLIEEPEFISDVPYQKHLGFARRLISRILGDAPPLDVTFGAFSGGASTSKTRGNSSPSRKFLDRADITAEAIPDFAHIVRDCPLWLERIQQVGGIRLVEGNVLFTVPKSTLIDRVACKEPDLNMFMQKGIGNFIRKRLKRFGIDLNDQSVNQSLAFYGSKTNALATLDLSSASDSVSTQLVYLLLPLDWFLLLDRVRSRVTVIDGERHENHMFSSMGNGFTFELESLLFFAIAKATAYCKGIRGRISVYGDDIICPSALYDSLVGCLSFYGFSVNPDKSFNDGPFRESCGAHWYDGKLVTPFYLKEPVTHMVDLIHLLNSLRKWSDFAGVPDPRVVELFNKYAKIVPDSLYGGQDYSVKYALVTGHRPREILSPIAISVDASHLGGYLHWLHSHDGYCGSETWQTSSVKKTSVKYKIYKNRQTVKPGQCNIVRAT